jgi:hypothetical protein
VQLNSLNRLSSTRIVCCSSGYYPIIWGFCR